MAINDNNLLINENSPEINDIRETTLESLPKEQLQKIYEYWKVTQLSQEVNQREQKRAFNTQSKINHFLNDKNITKKTKDNYKRILDIYMDFLALNSYHILDLNGDIALRFKSYLKTGKRTEPTITTYIRGVSSFYTYLIFVGDIQNNYFKGMIDKLHNKRAKDKGLMSETDYNSIIEHYQTSKKSKLNTLMPIIIEFLASTGLRVGALATIKIDKAGNYTTLTKGKEVKGSIEADLLTKVKGIKLNEASTNSLQVSFNRTIKKLFPGNPNNYSLHSLRALFATKLLEKGCGIYEIKKKLSLSSVTTTERYILEINNIKEKK